MPGGGTDLFIFRLVKLIINDKFSKTNIKWMKIECIKEENRVYKFKICGREKWNKKQNKNNEH